MQTGSPTKVDKIRLLNEIKRCVDEGKPNSQIAEELNVSLACVRLNKKFLVELASENLTPDILGSKRSELYIDLLYATQEARDLFEKYRDSGDGINAKRFLDVYIQSVIERARLYGVYSSAEAGVTINQQFNNFVQDTVSGSDAAKIAAILKDTHERTVEAKFKEKIIDNETDLN